MLKKLCLTVVVAVPGWVLACSSDEQGSPPPSDVAAAGQGGESVATPGGAAGQPSEVAGGAGGEVSLGGAPSEAGGGASDGGAPSSLDCGTGQICFFLDGEPLQNGGGGYRLTHATLGQYAFVKYEQGADQLSIDIYSLEPGTFEVLDVPTAGAARVTWYTVDVDGQHIYQGRSGTVTVTELDDDFFITGSFSAELELTKDDAYTGEKRSVTNGTFGHVFLPAVD